MKVRIIKSSDISYWYSDKINQIYEVEETPTCYITKEIVNSHDNARGFIEFTDCKIIDDTQTPTNPTHYHTKIQPIEFIEANNLGFHEGNVIKYITRYKDKNGIEDLEKAKTYIEMLIDKLKRENV